MVALNLRQIARAAISNAAASDAKAEVIVDPNSNDNTANKISIIIAQKFISHACPAFLEASVSEDVDRLVKIGRSIADLVRLADESNESDGTLAAGLSSIVEQLDILSSKNCKVPKVRFGKTELDMPIVTLGCMRFQQTWAPIIKDIGDVKKECQDNLYKLLKYSIEERGINHIETANMYGSSEVQLGDAFQRIFDDGIKREDLIIQTKVNAFDPVQFRKTLEDSFSKLRLDYIDLFSFHGINYYSQYETIFNNPDGENLIDIAREYVADGKIRNIGFSSHGHPNLIKKCIDSDAFAYANIHYHAFGSYTASGSSGKHSGGNLENLRLMKEKDMGAFIISPYDKGGRLYGPSRKLRSLTLPDLEPIQYGSLWLFHHEEMDKMGAPAHTIVCGAARPSDLDEPAVAAYLFATKKEETLKRVKAAAERLRQAEIDALGEEWMENWYEGLPNCDKDNEIYPIGQMIWLYNIVKAWGLRDFAKDRYGSFDGNSKNWDSKLSNEENIKKSKIMWGYMPGVAYDEDMDLSTVLADVPSCNRQKVEEAIKFLHDVCSQNSKYEGKSPDEWETSYDMRPWCAFPERK